MKLVSIALRRCIYVMTSIKDGGRREELNETVLWTSASPCKTDVTGPDFGRRKYGKPCLKLMEGKRRMGKKNDGGFPWRTLFQVPVLLLLNPRDWGKNVSPPRLQG